MKEAITLCALLKLPKQLPKSEKLERVKDILRELVRKEEVAHGVGCGVFDRPSQPHDRPLRVLLRRSWRLASTP